MVDTFTRADLEILLNTRNGHHLSLYMPTAKAGFEVKQNSIRFKNLLNEAEAWFSRSRVSSDVADIILNPLQALVQDNVFWANQESGLAVLNSRESSRTYCLPFECKPLVVLSGHFHLKPLIHFLQNDLNFYILALSQNRTKLLRCSRQQAEVIEPPNMPKGLPEALRYDDPQKQLQFHTGAPGTGGKRPAMFHGHGVGIDESKDNVLRYCYHVNKALEDVLRDERSPLILATVDYLFPLYRTANSYPFLLEDFVRGNPDDHSDQDLQNEALPVVEKFCKEKEEKAISDYREKGGTGLTSTDMEEVVLSASHGKVDSLFVAGDLERWGVFDGARDKVIFHDSREPHSYDLLNFGAVQTLLHGGSVLILSKERMPGGSPIAALFRY